MQFTNASQLPIEVTLSGGEPLLDDQGEPLEDGFKIGPGETVDFDTERSSPDDEIVMRVRFNIAQGGEPVVSLEPAAPANEVVRDIGGDGTIGSPSD